MAGFTQGPWFTNVSRAVYADVDGRIVKIGDTRAMHEEGVSLTQAKANAKLMAAAPQMLDILKEIANDSKVDLVDSERRMRLYNILHQLGEL